MLALKTRVDPSFDPADMEITAGVTSTCKPRPCAGIDTGFTLADGRAGGRQSVLTLATISDIPSYNRLTTGDGGTSVRGQFLEQNAASPVEDIAQPSVVLDFSHDISTKG